MGIPTVTVSHHWLIISIIGQGNTSPSPGWGKYTPGTIVSISAVPAPGWNFIEWRETGVAFSTNSSIQVLMDRSRSIAAVFEEIPEVGPPYAPIVLEQILRPDGPGDETGLHSLLGGPTWDVVNNETGDPGGGDFIGPTGWVWARDLYTIPSFSADGTIRFIKIYFRCGAAYGPKQAKPVMKVNGVITEGDIVDVPQYSGPLGGTSFSDFSQEFSVKPDGSPWQWSDLVGFQAGIALSSVYARCVQFYVKVGFSPPSIPGILVALSITVIGKGSTSPKPGLHITNRGQSITLDAIPDQGYEFVRWTDESLNTISTSRQVTVAMDDNKSFVAVFTGGEEAPAAPPSSSLATVVAAAQQLPVVAVIAGIASAATKVLKK